MKELTHIKGAKELDDVLKQLPPYIAERVLKGSVMAGAEVVRKEAVEMAPIGSAPRKDWKGRIVQPGTLKKSIKKFSIKDSAASVSVGVGLKKGSRGFYGRFFEFGTSKMAARPFIRPAFDNKAQEALDVMGKKLWQGIERAAKRLAGPYLKSGLRRK